MNNQGPAVAPISIAGRRIGPGEPPFIIAELSANHGGDIERALRIVRLAAEAGADAIKFQAYRAETMTLNIDKPGFIIEGDNPWTGQRLYELYNVGATPYDWFPRLFDEAHRCGIIPFASPFDDAAVDLLEELDAPAYKIASFEAVDLDLIERCAATHKPLIISTGMASEEEIGDALAAAAAADGIILLKCTSAYPADASEANLSTIPAMSRRFGVPVGLSDHTLGAAVPTAACALGACAVEKHFIDSRHPETADSSFSALPEEFRELVEHCRTAQLAGGVVQYGPAERESQSLAFRRSLYAVADIPAGAQLTRDNIRTIRPGFGLPAKHIREVLGTKAKSDIALGTPISWDLVR